MSICYLIQYSLLKIISYLLIFLQTICQDFHQLEDINKNINLFFYVGKVSSKFNGGEDGGGSGGSATDVRLIDGNWDNFDSLKSRILVAGGGGGQERVPRGNAGGLQG